MDNGTQRKNEGMEGTGMKIALIHEGFEEEHLGEVIECMERAGAPRIRAVWMECYGHWAALEGCHRIRAAKLLGLVPEIIEVDYDAAVWVGDNEVSEVSEGSEVPSEGYLASEIADVSNGSVVVCFEDEEQG